MDDLFHGTTRLAALEAEDEVLSSGLGAEGERLAASIQRAVWRETCGRVRHLSVEIGTTGIVLNGRCNTYYIKQKAQHAAMSVAEGRRLDNEIEVA